MPEIGPSISEERDMTKMLSNHRIGLAETLCHLFSRRRTSRLTGNRRRHVFRPA